jgi:hypothetical protein
MNEPTAGKLERVVNHELIDGTLVTEKGGIFARCVCGWVSGPHISSIVASAAFMDHQNELLQLCDDVLARRTSASYHSLPTDNEVMLAIALRARLVQESQPTEDRVTLAWAPAEMPHHWSVALTVDDKQVLSLHHDGMSGIEDISKYADILREVADHLRIFAEWPRW